MTEQVQPSAGASQTSSDSQMTTCDWRLRDEVFRQTTATDQDNYYVRTAEKNMKAARQVNRIRAGLSLFTGVAAALAGLITQMGQKFNPNDPIPKLDPVMDWFVRFLIVLSVALPAIAAGFNALADLYQWDRTTRIYRTARDVLKFTKSQEPSEKEEKGDEYKKALHAYSSAVLKIMEDEQAQWGMNIRVPEQTADSNKG